MIGGCVGDLAVSSAAATPVNSSAPTEIYRGFQLIRREGFLSIYLPDGSFLLTGRLSNETGRMVVDSIAEIEGLQA